MSGAKTLAVADIVKAYISMANIVMAWTVLADVVIAYWGTLYHKRRSYGMLSYGLYSYGLYMYGLSGTLYPERRRDFGGTKSYVKSVTNVNQAMWQV